MSSLPPCFPPGLHRSQSERRRTQAEDIRTGRNHDVAQWELLRKSVLELQDTFARPMVPWPSLDKERLFSTQHTCVCASTEGLSRPRAVEGERRTPPITEHPIELPAQVMPWCDKGARDVIVYSACRQGSVTLVCALGVPGNVGFGSDGGAWASTVSGQLNQALARLNYKPKPLGRCGCLFSTLGRLGC